MNQQQLPLLMDSIKKESTKQLQCMTSVSYTHLRAHETVLDLVCRLLLEKTNTYNGEVICV